MKVAFTRKYRQTKSIADLFCVSMVQPKKWSNKRFWTMNSNCSKQSEQCVVSHLTTIVAPSTNKVSLLPSLHCSSCSYTIAELFYANGEFSPVKLLVAVNCLALQHHLTKE